MHLFGIEILVNPGFVLFAVAGVALYIASRAGADALSARSAPTAGRLAFGHWLPVAAVAMTAMVLNRSAIAVGVVFGCSVAGLALGIGAIIVLAPVDAPVDARRRWPMVLPVALLVFLAGFRGELNLLHACVLAAEGLVILLLWNDRSTINPTSTNPASAGPPAGRGMDLPRAFQFLLALALTGLGAWAAVRGTERASQASDFASTGLMAATLLSPLLVLPMLGSAVDLAHQGRAGVAITSQIGLALLNLCLLLPLVIVEGRYHPIQIAATEITALVGESQLAAPKPVELFPATQLAAASPATSPATMPSTLPAIDDEPAAEPPPLSVPFPLAVWRVDSVVLIVLGLFLVPAGLGLWTLSKAEGFALIAGYAGYLVLGMSLARSLL